LRLADVALVDFHTAVKAQNARLAAGFKFDPANRCSAA